MARRKRMPETRGERIKRYRLAAGLSQPELAARLNISLATVSRWETAGRKPQQSHRSALAGALGVSWATLEHGEATEAASGLVGGAPRPTRQLERRQEQLRPLREAVTKAQNAGGPVLYEIVRAAVEVLARHRLT